MCIRDSFKVVSAPVADPSPANWVDLVPHRAGRLIIRHLYLKGRLIRLEREDGLPRIVIRDLATGGELKVALDAGANPHETSFAGPGKPVSYTHLDVYKRQLA